MIITDLSYMESVPETCGISGGKAIALADFWGLALGKSTKVNVDTNVFAVSGDSGSYAYSSVQVNSVASGDDEDDIFAGASASSSVFAS
jgi:hypothetical protein